MKIDRNKFVPCAMKCTKEQFSQIKFYLDIYDILYRSITEDFKEYSYMTNYYCGDINIISNIKEKHVGEYSNRIKYDEFDLSLFLKNCGIVDFNVTQNSTLISVF